MNSAHTCFFWALKLLSRCAIAFRSRRYLYDWLSFTLIIFDSPRDLSRQCLRLDDIDRRIFIHYKWLAMTTFQPGDWCIHATLGRVQYVGPKDAESGFVRAARRIQPIDLADLQRSREPPFLWLLYDQKKILEDWSSEGAAREAAMRLAIWHRDFRPGRFHVKKLQRRAKSEKKLNGLRAAWMIYDLGYNRVEAIKASRAAAKAESKPTQVIIAYREVTELART